MTARPIITLPWSVLRGTDFDWDLDMREQVQPEAVSGVSQTVYSAFPRWVGTPRLVLPPSLIGVFRAARWHGGGLQAIYRIQLRDPAIIRRETLASEDGVALASGLPFSTGATWSSGAGWAYEPFLPATNSYGAGTTSITVAETGYVAHLVPGMLVSHDHYVYGVTSVTLDSGNNARVLTIRPALRTAMVAGDPIHLIPIGLFEAATARTGNPGYNLDRVARPEFELREWLNRS